MRWSRRSFLPCRETVLPCLETVLPCSGDGPAVSGDGAADDSPAAGGLGAVGSLGAGSLGSIGRLGSTGAEALAREARRARARHQPSPERLPQPWTPAVLSLLLVVSSGLTAWPLHALARRWGLPAEAAGLAAVFWLLVPARTLFTPSLDQALVLPLVLALWLAAAGAGRGRRGGAPAALAGLLAAACCLTSFGYVAALPLVALAALPLTVLPFAAPPFTDAAPFADDAALPPGVHRRAGLRAALPPLAALAAGFAAPFAAAALAGLDILATFRTGLATHRSMAVVTRDYATWLRWNPWDFTLLLGPAIVALALAAVWSARRRPLKPVIVTVWGLLVLLWVSGSVRGEVGRIWLLFMPLACLAAAAAATALPRRPLRSPAGLALLAAQALLVLALAANMVFVS